LLCAANDMRSHLAVSLSLFCDWDVWISELLRKLSRHSMPPSRQPFTFVSLSPCSAGVLCVTTGSGAVLDRPVLPISARPEARNQSDLTELVIPIQSQAHRLRCFLLSLSGSSHYAFSHQTLTVLLFGNRRLTR
jgi:hypothetical protein